MVHDKQHAEIRMQSCDPLTLCLSTKHY